MSSLTIQLITHNNEATVENALKSLKPLNGDILVLDHHSTDNTVAISKQYATVKQLAGDRSDARNAAVAQSKTDWQFLLEPWEVISSGYQSILSFIKEDKNQARVYVSQGDLLTKQVRLWNKNSGVSFDGKVFESLTPTDNAVTINTLLSAEIVDTITYSLELLKEWKATNPTAAEPYYYAAMCHLSRMEYDLFIQNAEHFLFRAESLSMPVLMTRYYLAWTYCVIKRNGHQALKNLIVCLSAKPLMAEFWCLLGDIHYFLQYDFDKAYHFYRNALVLGTQRKTGDEWPVQMSKYGEYPRKMIDSCKAIKSNRKLLR